MGFNLFTRNSEGDIDGAEPASTVGPQPADADPDESITGEPYVIEAIGEVQEAGLITKTKIPAPEDEAKDTDVVVGPDIRKKIEKVFENEGQPVLPVGYDDSHGDLEITGFRLSDTFEHVLVAGSTGSSKSTVVLAVMYILGLTGYGFFSVYPKGSEDAEKLLSALPEHRLDDVIIVDPTEPEYTVPMNLLDVPEFDDPAEADDEVSKRVDVVKAVLMQDYGDGYINVETIIEVVSRAMMYSDDAYSFVDMFLLLLSQDRREDFVERIDDPLVADAMSEVAAMDDDDVRPVLKRLMAWVLDPTVRRSISHRESSVDWRGVIDENKIVLLMLGVSNKSVKRQYVLTAWRQLTSAVQQRYNETGRQIPYVAFLDEFNDVASDKLNLQDNLARARAMGLSLWILCQYPSQLPDTGNDSVQKAAKSNTKNTVALTMEEDEDAKVMASKLRGIDYEDIKFLPNFQCWTDVPIGNGERSDAVRLKTIPPMAPLRTEDEVDRVKMDILKREGVEPPTIREMVEDSPLDVDAVELLSVGDGEKSLDPDESIREPVCKAVYDQAISGGAEDGWVALDDATPRIRRYLPGSVTVDTTEQLYGRVIEKIPKSHLEDDMRDGTTYLRCTDEGALPIFEQGDKQNSAGPLHRKLLNNAYGALTELGFVVEIPEQEGTSELDARASLDDVDILRFDDDTTPKQIHDAYAEFETSDEYALLSRLSGGETVSIEAEESTGKTAPAQTIVNLQKAVGQGRRCLFLARTEEIARLVWEHLAEEPKCMRDHEKRRHRLYNTNADALRIGGRALYRPAGPRETVWIYDETVEQYVLEDSEGEVHARFDSADAIRSEPETYPKAEGEIEDYDDWVPVKAPIVPSEACLDTDNWDILVVDADAESPLSVYGDGEMISLDELLEHESESEMPMFDI